MANTMDEFDEFVNWGEVDISTTNISASAPAAPAAPAAVPAAAPVQIQDQYMSGININSDPNLDLALESAPGDNFSFCALEHFASLNNSFDAIGDGSPVGNMVVPPPSVPVPAPTSIIQPPGPRSGPEPGSSLSDMVGSSLEWWETPNTPCDHCRRGGYQCKKLQEGEYRGYCTSCVALRCQCSFGLVQGPAADSPSALGATFPPNPWPTLGDHPDPIINHGINRELVQLERIETPDLASLPAGASKRPTALQPKVGARLSKESVKIMKNWISTHSKHPYPTDEEKEGLARQTGLNKVQIANWLANARRRGKMSTQRSTSPHVSSILSSSAATAIDIPRRRGTPALEAMNPLQRWVESPPDHEPASVTDIARAIGTTSSSNASSGLNSPLRFTLKDDGSGISMGNASSASSIGTSHSSNNSFASAYSFGSRGSLGSFNSFSRGRRRRRRKRAPDGSTGAPKDRNGGPGGTLLSTPLKTYQCTFCTLTFRTKHDWQRHEKSLHLSLERWVCAPDGARAPNPGMGGQVCCVFCGKVNPDDEHVDSHDHASCQERPIGERIFYRKDHLRQHLRLVHDAKFMDWSMEAWKVSTPEIRSRCGFCGIVMDSWTFRVDHLAEHFKMGYSMADWKGDWGFEPPVLQMVENSIPPFLIDQERNSPHPYSPDSSPPESPRNAYSLLKLELLAFSAQFVQEHGREATDSELRYEACRIIFGSEILSRSGISSVPSWLRDVIMETDPEAARRARVGPVRGPDENRLTRLSINGKDNIFDDCPLEKALCEFVTARSMLGLTPTDTELQEECCRIISRREEMCSQPADKLSSWIVRLVYSSGSWLSKFRRRASLPRSEDVVYGAPQSKDPSTIDSTIHNFSRLEMELSNYARQQQSLGLEPTDAELQRQGRLIIYGVDDPWNQTAVDNERWLAAFRERNMIGVGGEGGGPPGVGSLGGGGPPPAARPPGLDDPLTLEAVQGTGGFPASSSLVPPHVGGMSGRLGRKSSHEFLNDGNCYRRLAQQLGRWVRSTMSPNNPNRHTPTDLEMQHQARWILYDDDDPWNQTAADNAEWLQRFKVDVGILSAGSAQGLGTTNLWTASPVAGLMEMGGLADTGGFADTGNFAETAGSSSMSMTRMSGSSGDMASAAKGGRVDRVDLGAGLDNIMMGLGGGDSGGAGTASPCGKVRVEMTEDDLDNMLRDMRFGMAGASRLE